MRLVLRQIHEEEVEQLPTTQPSDICTYWPPNAAFDPKRVLLRRMFFINEDKTKYVSVGYYPARDYQPLVEFGAIRWGGSKSLILTDEQATALADCLLYATPCVSSGTVSSSSAKVATFVYTPQEARIGQTVCRHGIHKPDTA